MSKHFDDYGDSKDYRDCIDSDDNTHPAPFGNTNMLPEQFVSDMYQSNYEIEREIAFNTESAMNHIEYCNKYDFPVAFPQLVVNNG